MKTTPLIIICFVLLALSTANAALMGTAFSYQGRLNDAGQPASGMYDLRFAVFDAAQAGSGVGAILTNAATPVISGLFTVTLDFGPGVFTGEARWLEIGVRTNGSRIEFTILTPRQPLGPVPYALHAPTAGSAAAVTGPVAAGQITGTLAPSNFAAGSISATHLAVGSVTTAALADGAVTAAKMATASNWVALGQLISNPNPSAWDQFGNPITTVGHDSVVIGARYADAGAVDAGAAYRFNADGGLLGAFYSPKPEESGRFGYAISAVGSECVLIAAPFQDKPVVDAGTAYLFSTRGDLVYTFTNPVPAVGDHFGLAVAGLSSTRVVISAPHVDTGANNAGVAYVYTSNAMSRGWVLTTLANPAPAANDRFGQALAGVGPIRVLVGAPYKSTGATNAGVAYLFETDGTLLTTFTNPAPGSNDYFSSAVAALGTDRVLISAPYADANGPDAGAVYLFSTNGTLLTTFTGTQAGALFGSAVAATPSGQVMIGAIHQDTGAADAGAAYLFNTNGALVATFTSPAPASQDGFGSAGAAVGSDRVFVGAPEADPQGTNAGAAYLFKLQTYMPGVVADEVRAGSVTTASIANGAVGSTQLAQGAAVANLYAGGQSGVALGGVVMSEDPDNAHLLNAGYIRLGSSASLNVTVEAWRNLASGPLLTTQLISGRTDHSAVWTGTEMIVWGGYNDDGLLNTGARYDPALDSWTSVSQANAPNASDDHKAVWTGTQMIIWQGNAGSRYNPAANTWSSMSTTGAPLLGGTEFRAAWSGSIMVVLGAFEDGWKGGRYNPSSDSWAQIHTNGAPSPRYGFSTVWTGTKIILFGGYDYFNTPVGGGTVYLNDGGLYDPVADAWSSLKTSGAPGGRTDHTAVWTGSRMIVWGGHTEWWGAPLNLNDGGVYDPSANVWGTISTTGAPAARRSHTAVWTGSRMVVWGGVAEDFPPFPTPPPPPTPLAAGAVYNPTTDTWSNVATSGAPEARFNYTAVWSGSRMLVWGGTGSDHTSYPAVGHRYDPVGNGWTPMSTLPAGTEPGPRRNATAFWTGSEMIVWGGENNGQYLRSGARFDPAANAWSALPMTNAPAARVDHTAVWTGTEMLVWGGYNGQTLSSGGRYKVAQNTWSAIPTNNTPSARRAHSAVWTGDEMIVWGGYSRWYSLNKFLATGGRYVPGSSQWTSVSTNGAPEARAVHTAVWTGDEMIIWGGFNQVGSVQPENIYFNSGTRYRPALDSGGSSAPWMAITTDNAPTARRAHTAVWSGKEMVVWGGENGAELNTGGRYLPDSDSWVSIAATGAPSARQDHTAVWTGAHMLLWGGRQGATEHNTGARYSPTLDRWWSITTASAPGARYDHCAAWTGSEMLIWGGFDGASCLDTIKGYTPPVTLYLYLKP